VEAYEEAPLVLVNYGNGNGGGSYRYGDSGGSASGRRQSNVTASAWGDQKAANSDSANNNYNYQDDVEGVRSDLQQSANQQEQQLVQIKTKSKKVKPKRPTSANGNTQQGNSSSIDRITSAKLAAGKLNWRRKQNVIAVSTDKDKW